MRMELLGCPSGNGYFPSFASIKISKLRSTDQNPMDIVIYLNLSFSPGAASAHITDTPPTRVRSIRITSTRACFVFINKTACQLRMFINPTTVLSKPYTAAKIDGKMLQCLEISVEGA